jgi:hypothetical protein
MAEPISNACASADIHLHQRQFLARFHQRQCLTRSAGADDNVSHLQLPTISGRALDQSRQGVSVIWPDGDVVNEMRQDVGTIPLSFSLILYIYIYIYIICLYYIYAEHICTRNPVEPDRTTRTIWLNLTCTHLGTI